MTIATLGSMRTKAIVRKGSPIRTFSGQSNCSRGSVGRGSSIRQWIRASELPRSARPAKLQLEMQAKNPIRRPIQVIAAIATAMVRTARMMA
jgi:hypothetical protein